MRLPSSLRRRLLMCSSPESRTRCKEGTTSETVSKLEELAGAAGLVLPQDYEDIIKLKMQRVAAETRSRHVYERIGDDRSGHALRVTKLKAHDNAVKKCFPTFTHRWFERPVFRRQQAEEGVGPFYCLGVRPGELASATDFNKKWIEEHFSREGQLEALIYLRITEEWTNTSVQGSPAIPIGINGHEYGDREKHRMFVNETGLSIVPTHMVWITTSCIDWMERHPCLNNSVYLVDDDVLDAYSRVLNAGLIDMRFTYSSEGRVVGDIVGKTCALKCAACRLARETPTSLASQ
eukprot:659968-Amphidinium_carterae.14